MSSCGWNNFLFVQKIIRILHSWGWICIWEDELTEGVGRSPASVRPATSPIRRAEFVSPILYCNSILLKFESFLFFCLFAQVFTQTNELETRVGFLDKDHLLHEQIINFMMRLNVAVVDSSCCKFFIIKEIQTFQDQREFVNNVYFFLHYVCSRRDI